MFVSHKITVPTINKYFYPIRFCSLESSLIKQCSLLLKITLYKNYNNFSDMSNTYSIFFNKSYGSVNSLYKNSE